MQISSRFSQVLHDKLSFDAILAFPGIAKVFDIGFVRFDNNKLNSVYLFVTYDDLHPGFVKFSFNDDKFIPNSIYYVVDSEWEVRYGKDGEILYTYFTKLINGMLEIDKIKNGEVIETQVIEENKVKEFPEIWEQIKLHDLLEKQGGSKFRYFDKNDGKTIYLFIQHCESREEMRKMIEGHFGVALLI